MLLPVRKNGAEKPAGASAAQEVLLVRRLVVGVARRDDDAFHTQRHHLVKESAHAVRIGAIEERGIRRNTEAALDRLAYSLYRLVVTALAANGKIVVLALTIEMDGESQVLTGLKESDLLLEQQSVGAEIDVLLPRHQAFNNLANLRVHQRFAAGNGDHGRTALVDCPEALLGRELLLEDVCGILNFAAACASQIAAEQRFQHKNERVAFLPAQALLEHVAGHGPHL